VRGGCLSLKQLFSLHSILFYYYPMLNILIHLFVVLFGTVSLLVLLIMPQDPNNRSSAAQTIEGAVCVSPRVTRSYNSPVGKVPEGSAFLVRLKIPSNTKSHFICWLYLKDVDSPQ